MSSINITVLSSVAQWLKKQHSVFLVTVIHTWGASPRPVGSLFAFNLQEQQQVGSLSGGCIEEHLIQYLVEKSQSEPALLKQPILKRYGAADGDLAISLPCGGILEVLIELLSTPADNEHIDILLNNLNKQQRVMRCVEYNNTEQTILRSAIYPSESFQHNSVLLSDPVRGLLQHCLAPSYRLLIVGAGDIAHYLKQAAVTVEFAVTICEPRKEILQRLPGIYQLNTEIINALPDDLIKSSFNDAFTAIVCLSHDPRVDDMALLEALTNSKAFYIGAMGSLKTSEARRMRLRSLGLNDTELSRLYAPIGLDISSKTPSEIAISIMAQLISKRFAH